MESDIYGNTALPLAPDLQSLQTPHDIPHDYKQELFLNLISIVELLLTLFSANASMVPKDKYHSL